MNIMTAILYTENVAMDIEVLVVSVENIAT